MSATSPSPLNAATTTCHLVARLRAVAGRQATALGALMLAAAVFESFGLLLLLPIISLLIPAQSTGDLAQTMSALGIVSPHARLAILLGVFVLAGLTRAYIGLRRDLAAAQFQVRFAMHERENLVDRLAAARWSDIAALPHAQVANAMTIDIERATATVQMLVRIVVTLATLAAQLVVALVVSVQLTLLALVLVVTGALYAWMTQSRALKLGSANQNAMQDMQAMTAGFMAGLKTAMSENTQSTFLSGMKGVLDRIRANQLDQQATQARSRQLFACATTLFAATIVGTGALLDVSPARMIAIVVVIARMATPTLSLQQTVQSYLFTLPNFAAMERLRAKIADQTPPPVTIPQPVTAPFAQGRIRLEGATMRHSGGGGVGPADLSIEPGEIVGITGPSGAGKSTLLDLITGLQPAQKGNVRIDGQCLDRHNGPGWRLSIAFQSQATFQTNDTVRANLLLSGADADEAAMWDALRMVCVEDVVRAMPSGLDSAMGEPGAGLSGGERQRIALARGLLRRPALLILDEALVAVDVETETRILDNIRKAHPRTTIVVVAHRRESLATCTREIRLENGMIVG